MKPVVTRNLMLNYIKDTFSIEKSVNPCRVFEKNKKAIGNGNIFYIMTRELRIEDNWGLNFALELAKKHSKNLKILVFLDEKLISERQFGFLKENLSILEENLKINNFNYKILQENIEKELKNAGAVVFDLNPISQKDFIKKLNCKAFEVDSHNIIPARFISDKQEFSAATLRRKVYANIAGFLKEYPEIKISKRNSAYEKLKNFIDNILENYPTEKNNPNKKAVSELSPYLHFGFISSQRIAIEVLKSNASNIAKETFLEELIVRKELADNFCLYSNGFKNFDSIPVWAKETLSTHQNDIKTYLYKKDEFEQAKTHDALWNAAQNQLLRGGKIHGFLRMYWAKKILEWSPNPNEALKTAIYLNDTYALDGNDPNGYVGILWSIGGLHDRAFASRPVFGKIRYMSLDGCKKKFDINEFVRKYN